MFVQETAARTPKFGQLLNKMLEWYHNSGLGSCGALQFVFCMQPSSQCGRTRMCTLLFVFVAMELAHVLPVHGCYIGIHFTMAFRAEFVLELVTRELNTHSGEL